MNYPRPLIAICLLTLLLLGATPTSAQSSNTQHEELKKQADDAYRAGDFAKSIELADQVVAENESDHVALYLRGSARVDLGIQQRDADLIRDGITDAREAIRIVNRVKIDYYLPYLYGMNNLAALEQKPANAEVAADVATKLLAMSKLTTPERANISYQRALIHLQLRDPQQAKADFEQAINYDRNHLASHLELCELLRQTAQPEDTEAAFDRAVSIFSDDPMVWNNRGMFLQSIGRVDDAIADFNHAIELNAEFVPAYTNRGFTHLSAGQPAEAIEDFSRAIEIDPQQPPAFSLRGTAQLQIGEIEAATRDYQAAVELHPGNPGLRADLGFAHFYAKDYTAALEAFAAAYELDATAKFLQPWQAAALIASDQGEQAAEDFAATREKPAAERDWYDMLVLRVLGDVDDNTLLSAISGANAAQEDAQKCEAYYFIGLSWSLQGKAADAEAFFRQALQSQSNYLAAYRGAQIATGEFTSTSNE